MNHIIIDQWRVLCEIQANQSNSSPLNISQPINVEYSTCDRINIRHVQLPLWKQEILWLFNVKKNMSIGNKTEDGENLFSIALANRFWLTSKSYSWFNNVVYGRPSVKQTSWKSTWSVTKSRLDVEFVKTIALEMVIGQQIKEEGLDENY